MQFIPDGEFSHKNVNALKEDFVDLLFCLEQKKNVSTSSLKNDILLALRLINSYLHKAMPQTDFLTFVQFVLNLYTLLLQKVYLPNYHQHHKYSSYVKEFQSALV